MKIRSIKANSFINAVRSLLSIVFPLITFKYASGILLVDNMGKYNFSVSFIAYFSLIGALGINAYAIRSGARIRDDRARIEKFVSEVFTLNVISTVVSYVLLFVILLWAERIFPYRILILILSTQIMFKTIGVEWLYSIYEDYLFVTVRSICIKILALVLVFVLVRQVDDVNNYAWVTVIAAAGNGLIDYVFAYRHCRIRFTGYLNLREHLGPVMILFAQNISLVIYVQSDTTILGLLTSDYYTGLYGLATNIYTGLKMVLCALVIVAIPRLSFYLGKNDKKNFQNTLNGIFEYMMTFVFPVIVGVMMLSREIILILADESFMEADAAIRILCLSTLFAMLSYIYGQCILLPMKREKIILLSTMTGAVVNVILNFFFIPRLQHNGAAVTTLISEAVVFLISWAAIRDEVRIENAWRYVLRPVIGMIPIVLTCLTAKHFFANPVSIAAVAVVGSVCSYFAVELWLKNSVILGMVRGLKNKMGGAVG